MNLEREREEDPEVLCDDVVEGIWGNQIQELEDRGRGC